MFFSWFNAADGATNLAKWGVSYLAAYAFLYGTPRVIRELSEDVKPLVAEANQFIIATMRCLCAGFEKGNYSPEGNPELNMIRLDIEQRHSTTCKGLRNILTKVEAYAMTRGIIHWE